MPPEPVKFLLDWNAMSDRTAQEWASGSEHGRIEFSWLKDWANLVPSSTKPPSSPQGWNRSLRSEMDATRRFVMCGLLE